MEFENKALTNEEVEHVAGGDTNGITVTCCQCGKTFVSSYAFNEKTVICPDCSRKSKIIYNPTEYDPFPSRC